ncbi:protein of unknown function [Mesotoga infera]|uniref:Uncharacterized protein n=1 Tax=Mesotoga infera TaxID=1236046 RepID=A0A7Z7LFY2_9BACT|nr:protein of unknown function [Mesotoga infera]
MSFMVSPPEFCFQTTYEELKPGLKYIQAGPDELPDYL